MDNRSLADLPLAARALFEFWCDARGTATLPCKSTIDPIRLRRWVGDISLIELHEGENRFWVRLHGTNLSNYVGVAFERGYLEDRIASALHAVALEPYHVAISEKLPTYSVIRPGLFTGIFDQFERLILPFCGDDEGEGVNRFVVWAAPLVRDIDDPGTAYGTGGLSSDEEKRASRLTILRPDDLAAEGK